MTTKQWALLAIVLGNLIFGFSFLFSRLALEMTVPAVLISVRFLTAFAVLNLIVLVGGLLRRKDGTPLIRFSLRGKPLKPILLLALCQPIIYFACESYGIVYTSTSFSGIIIATMPFCGILWDVLLMHEKVRGRAILCAAGSVAGVALTTIGSGDLRASLKGLLFLLGAVVAGSLFSYFAKMAAPWYDPLERTYVMFAGGALFYTLVTVIQCRGRYEELVRPALRSHTFWIAIFYLAVISSVVAFLLLNFATAYMKVSTVNLFANLTTVVSVAAGVLILKESFSLMQLIGSLIILSSVYLAKPSEG